MENEKLTPKESLELITQAITQARGKFEENGFIYMFWGLLIALATFSQFILLKNEYYEIHWYPYFLMPIGAVVSAVYFSKKKKDNHNQISKIVSMLWIVLSLNMMILGFVFATVIKENLIPFILILQAVGMLISGGLLKTKLLIYAGLVINVSGFICFYLDWTYHPLLSGIVATIAIFIPGLILMIQHKNRKNV